MLATSVICDEIRNLMLEAADNLHMNVSINKVTYHATGHRKKEMSSYSAHVFNDIMFLTL
jgi:hypothetical protein